MNRKHKTVRDIWAIELEDNLLKLFFKWRRCRKALGPWKWTRCSNSSLRASCCVFSEGTCAWPCLQSPEITPRGHLSVGALYKLAGLIVFVVTSSATCLPILHLPPACHTPFSHYSPIPHRPVVSIFCETLEVKLLAQVSFLNLRKVYSKRPKGGSRNGPSPLLFLFSHNKINIAASSTGHTG